MIVSQGNNGHMITKTHRETELNIQRCKAVKDICCVLLSVEDALYALSLSTKQKQAEKGQGHWKDMTEEQQGGHSASICTGHNPNKNKDAHTRSIFLLSIILSSTHLHLTTKTRWHHRHSINFLYLTPHSKQSLRNKNTLDHVLETLESNTTFQLTLFSAGDHSHYTQVRESRMKQALIHMWISHDSSVMLVTPSKVMGSHPCCTISILILQTGDFHHSTMTFHVQHKHITATTECKD